jgi:nicotinamide-nucleotide amidase
LLDAVRALRVAAGFASLMAAALSWPQLFRGGSIPGGCRYNDGIMSDLFKLAERLGKQLLARGRLVAVAESCTGGWVAKCLTDVPGSSQWFDRGFVTYSNAAKQDMLGVGAATLETHGAVSEATVAAMADGVLAHSRADLALAISGIAGPGGAVPGKPVGTVCFAWADRRGGSRIETRRFAGDREQVRRAAVIHGINGLLELDGNG